MISGKTYNLLRGLFAVDENGNTYLRVIETEPEALTNAVNSKSNRSLDTLLNEAVVLDSDGNPALRLAFCSFGKTKGEAEIESREKGAEAIKKAKEAAAKEAEKAKLKDTEEAPVE